MSAAADADVDTDTASLAVTVIDNDASADVNGDGSIGPLDGLLMYYAYTFEAAFKLDNDLGVRVRGFLRTLRGTGSPPDNDTGYKTMLDNAWRLRPAPPS